MSSVKDTYFIDWPDTAIARTDSGRWDVYPLAELRTNQDTLTAQGAKIQMIVLGQAVPQPLQDSWTIETWAGDWRYGSYPVFGPPDTLYFPRAFELSARVLHSGVPSNGAHYTWLSSGCSVMNLGAAESTRSWTNGADTLAGLARGVISIDNLCEEISEISCSLDNGRKAAFHVRKLGSNDTDRPDSTLVPTGLVWSPLIFDYRAPFAARDSYWSSGDIYPGDGLVNTADDDPNVMDVAYTLNCKSSDWLSESLSALIAKVDSIFRTAGLRAICVASDTNTDDCGTGWVFQNIHPMRKILKEIREDHPREHRGQGCGAIEAVLGGEYAGPGSRLEGLAVSYEPFTEAGREPTSLMECIHLSSSGLNPQMENECLDSCGVFVFTDLLCDSSLGNIRGIDRAALDLAHEIGHGLGLGHTEDRGVMAESLRADQSYDHYSYFAVPDLEARLDRSLMNFREILGREAVTVNRCNLVPAY